MQISVIAIGDELLIGQVTDTNSGAIARMIAPLGWSLHDVQVVGDDAQAIRQAIDRAMQASQVVITTGGLGPTKDDITKGVLADIFGGPLIFNQDVADNVARVFERRGLQLNDLTRSQALVPRSCQVLQNTLGTAPIMVFQRDGRMLIAMPGVPFETLGMMRRTVLPLLMECFHDGACLHHHTLMVSGITESDLAEKLAAWEASHPKVHLAYLPTPAVIRLRLDAVDINLDGPVRELCELLGPLLLYDGDFKPAEIALTLLRERHATLATAESCTGGTIASRLTAIPGASDVYAGGVVAYSNAVKHRLLGVRESTLARFGAVSRETVKAMAEGAQGYVGAEYAIATSGIAGPGGATPTKPVGTVWVAVATPDETITQLLHCPGDRARVIDRASTEALIMLIKALK